MRKANVWWIAVAVLALVAGAYVQTNAAPVGAKAGFEMIKALAGTWEGKNSMGNSVTATYAVVSGGSAVLETLAPQGEPNMVTLYHLDGAKLMLTHYCAAGNQPRMRLVAESDAKEVAFKFQDATNLPSAEAGHMVAVTIAWKDEEHMTQSWTWREKGKPDKVEVFQFTRKK
jgi:hypothetical protein